ncbi:MAG: protein kinase [Phycisphaeraceae bacterium]
MLVRLTMIAVVLAWCPAVLAEEFIHEANVMARLGNHPNVVRFIGVNTLDLALETRNGVDNPLYKEHTMQGENPLYTGSADPGTPGAIQSITFELDNRGLAPHLHAEGIVHRDIAARNFLVTTDQGVYGSAAGASIRFGHDGPPDLRTNVGPVRWMAPESLRLHRSGSTDPNDYIEIAEGSFFEASYVPEPSSLGLIALGFGALSRRRR